MGKLQDAINITGIDLTADELKILYHAWIQPQSFPLDVPIVGHDYAEEQLALWRTFLIPSGLLEYDPESYPFVRIGAKGRELIEKLY